MKGLTQPEGGWGATPLRTIKPSGAITGGDRIGTHTATGRLHVDARGPPAGLRGGRAHPHAPPAGVFHGGVQRCDGLLVVGTRPRHLRHDRPRLRPVPDRRIRGAAGAGIPEHPVLVLAYPTHITDLAAPGPDGVYGRPRPPAALLPRVRSLGHIGLRVLPAVWPAPLKVETAHRNGPTGPGGAPLGARIGVGTRTAREDGRSSIRPPGKGLPRERCRRAEPATPRSHGLRVREGL
jgi:hypothetical protein